MGSYRIALYPGDGIGVDVAAEAMKACAAAGEVCGFALETEEFDWGHRHWKRTGAVVPDDYLDVLRDFPVVYLGAIGDPANVPDHISLVPLIEMRQTFDQYLCLRPATLLPGVATPLAGKAEGEIDILVVRENSEGEYIAAGGLFHPRAADGLALEAAVHTRKGVERILRRAFELAQGRRRRLTMATKSNALKHGMVYWDTILGEVRGDYPDVEAQKCHIDALAMNFVRKPEIYDVVVGSNLFGDILSDLGGAVVGSLGLAPSANINPERAAPSLFEPVHGSAPDIAGQGIANPVAAIRSAGMMLEFLGEKEAADLVESAVRAALADASVRTPDLGGTDSTAAMGDEIVRRIRAAN